MTCTKSLFQVIPEIYHFPGNHDFVLCDVNFGPWNFFIQHQGIIQKKSAPGIRTLPLVIFDKKGPFFSKNNIILRYLCVKLCQKCLFLKIPDAALKF